MKPFFKKQNLFKIATLVLFLIFAFNLTNTASANLPSETFIHYVNIDNLRNSIREEFGNSVAAADSFLNIFSDLGGDLSDLDFAYNDNNEATGDVTNMVNELKAIGSTKLNTITQIFNLVSNLDSQIQIDEVLTGTTDIKTWLNIISISDLNTINNVTDILTALINLGATYHEIFDEYGGIADFILIVGDLDNLDLVNKRINSFAGQPGGSLNNILTKYGGSLPSLLEDLGSTDDINNNGEEDGDDLVNSLIGLIRDSSTRAERDAAVDQQEIQILQQLQQQDATLCQQQSGGGFSTNEILGSLTDSEVFQGIGDLNIDDLTSLLPELGSSKLETLVDTLDNNQIRQAINNLPSRERRAIEAVIDSGGDPRELLKNVAMDKLSGALAGLGGGVLSGALSTFMNGGDLTSIVSSIGGSLLSNFATSIPGLGAVAGLIPGLGGGLHVPTQEQQGPLLSTTQIIQSLSTEVCTYSKTTKRIQQAMEKQTLALEPKIRRDGATQAAQFTKEFLDKDVGVLYTGGNDGGPMFVQNSKDYYDKVEKEATAVYIDELLKSEDEHKTETVNTISQQVAQENSSLAQDSTLPKNDVEKLMTGQVDNYDDFWNFFEKASDYSTPNTPITSYLLGVENIEKVKAEAEENAREEVVSAQGYLASNVCEGEWITNYIAGLSIPICTKWVKKAPGDLIKNANEKIQDVALDKAINPQPGDLSPGSEPRAQDIIENIYTEKGGGGPGGASLNLGGILNLILDLFKN